MITIDATTVKNKFGETIDKARLEPVLVTKSGRNAVVIISMEEYEHLQSMEDAYWADKARSAEQSGYVGAEKSQAFLNGLLQPE
jgi:prevent-host-death family protein